VARRAVLVAVAEIQVAGGLRSKGAHVAGEELLITGRGLVRAGDGRAIKGCLAGSYASKIFME
jgi:hypothetical protein